MLKNNRSIWDKKMNNWDKQSEELKRRQRIITVKAKFQSPVEAINSRSISLNRCGIGIMDWTKNDKKKLDKKARKLLKMYGAHHKKAGINQLYMKKEQGGRGLIPVEMCTQCYAE